MTMMRSKVIYTLPGQIKMKGTYLQKKEQKKKNCQTSPAVIQTTQMHGTIYGLYYQK